jgi:hypothetical protein
MTLTFLSIALAAVAAVVGWYFCWLYNRNEYWRGSEAGRHLMYFTGGMAVTMTWVVLGAGLRYFWPEADWLDMFLAVGRIVIFAWLTYMLIQRTRLLRKAIAARKDRS